MRKPWQYFRDIREFQKFVFRPFVLTKTSRRGNSQPRQFETLPFLRFLAVYGAKLIGDSEGLLPNLRWLVWKGCPAFVATSFCLEKLVILDLSRSDISDFWEGWSHLKVAEQLKVLDLTYCRCLNIIPDLSAFENLEILILEGCNKLEQIPHSIGKAKGLIFLNLQGCEKLQGLPQEMGNLEQLGRSLT
ncbi:disease resistance protein RML1B-like [Eucalyptus grandis]|uniref:disease resistance protein RML1B-like n=1 Tax=Eucalyptus grandis TaxID=71139 RepID=UPI00192E9EA4|nr:disease resistance protein RML1B-like [Eucalyptus grandis]